MPFHYMTDVNCVEAIQQWAQHWPLWYTVLQQMSGWEFTPYASWYVRSDRKELIHCSEVLFMPKVTRSRCRSRSWSTQSNSQLLFIACSHFRYNFCCRKILQHECIYSHKLSFTLQTMPNTHTNDHRKYLHSRYCEHTGQSHKHSHE